tara:strand:- start:553 stop:1065 length:513 start_codon:yes stop_codon:yes gene_type:complete
MKKQITELTPINAPFIIDKENNTTIQTYIVRFSDLSSSLLYHNTQNEFQFKEQEFVEVTVENMGKPFKFGKESFSTKVRLSAAINGDSPTESDSKPNQPINKTRDEAIIFQNQSHLVQAYFKDCGICPDLFDINLGADLQVQFAIQGFSKELMERFKSFQTYIEEKYRGK